MVHHIIVWKLKEFKTLEEKEEVKKNIKNGLEGLKDVIPGLIHIKVITEGLKSSNADLMLDSAFEDKISLNNYSVNPAHVSVATGVVRPNVETRMCFDYEE